MSGVPDCVVSLWRHTEKAPSVAGVSPFSYDDAIRLRRIAMTLDNWHLALCNGVISRDYETGKVTRYSYPVPDRERGALKRLAKIMERYPDFLAYVQGDPRGPPLYIVAKADIPEGGTLDQFYTRGVALYK